MINEGPDHASGLQAVAERYGVGLDAVRHLMHALERGQGNMAQFDHPDLGGMGQWSAGGMIMVGDMFNTELKARVSGLCTELAAALPPGGWSAGGAPEGQRGGGTWWPADLGHPSSTGSQNGLRYAYFPESRRLAIESGAGVALYDTGEHQISGVSQSNGALSFSGPQGAVAVEHLRRIGAEAEAAMRQPATAMPSSRPEASQAYAPAPNSAASPSGDVLGTIERLAELHGRGVLTDQEFADKKAELLARL
ncbi:SHOCT domain-containing protein [Methylobacterium gregans]|uniref:SHOCT domain-containing protein n=2 Tax=Methylobacterium gregans TaxID=374424 RepID=A0AA37HSX2_9HYPH|nr:SHOCT domain-containing protein [Methylobacterium gregans]MDQ0522606.1 hypothetical protein [Methylobacterium gregans]GJD81394.1 hypothetical protein NBEOAGPD_4641 [Methylobacterium gregans]